MALDIFELDGMTPETKMSGDKSYITTFYKFGCYQWVYFRDTSVTFPGDKLFLGRYSGKSIDVGHALTAKIQRKNWQQVHRSTYRLLAPDKLVNPDEIKACDELDTTIGKKLYPSTSDKYFESDPEIFTPTLDRYEDDEEHQTDMPVVNDITDEAMENYIGADIMIFHGDTVYQGSVRLRKRDVEGSIISISNSNPILDTQTYEVEFEGGSMSTYYENVIAESMYAKYDVKG